MTRARVEVPLPGVLRTLSEPPWRAARSRIERRPRWPGNSPWGRTRRRSRRSQALWTLCRTASSGPPHRRQVRRAGAGVLDDVVERLLGDAVDLLPRLRRGSGSSQRFARALTPRRASRASACFLSAATRPSGSSDSGLSSKISARISARPSWPGRARSPAARKRRGDTVRGAVRFLQEIPSGVRAQDDAVKGLGDGVVQLAGEAWLAPVASPSRRRTALRLPSQSVCPSSRSAANRTASKMASRRLSAASALRRSRRSRASLKPRSTVESRARLFFIT